MDGVSKVIVEGPTTELEFGMDGLREWMELEGKGRVEDGIGELEEVDEGLRSDGDRG